jgi:hypothetical protein
MIAAFEPCFWSVSAFVFLQMKQRRCAHNTFGRFSCRWGDAGQRGWKCRQDTCKFEMQCKSLEHGR